MDSSSDEGFAWTDASDNNSSDNETMAKNNHCLNQSGEESESGKTFKKELQQRLFSNNGDREPVTNKRSQHLTEADHSYSPKKKRVKVEPESDVEIPKKKKKISLDSKSPKDDCYDESFLNSKVKSEQTFLEPSPIKVKKNKKKNVTGANDTICSNGDSLDSKKLPDAEPSSEEPSTPPSTSQEEVENEQSKTKAKKKKKKSGKETLNTEVDNVQNCAEEDSFRTDQTSVGKSSVTELKNMLGDEISESLDTHNHSNHNNQTKNNQQSSSDSENTLNHTSVVKNSKSLFDKRSSRMSERIQFEDDFDINITSNSIDTSMKSLEHKKLKSFIKESSVSLRPLRTELPNSLLLSAEDDVWLVRCPTGVRLEAFAHKKWVLDGRCKIKLDGQTYEGDIAIDENEVTILSSHEDRGVLGNVKTNGCIRLRRRLPKVHTQEENIMVNNQTNFIPLPETKCRHPLFGPHYKKAIKLPKEVAKRLHSVPPDPAEPSEPPELLVQKKKKKKRKHSDTAPDESIPHPKKAKRNLESAEAWDSEKAIEENLFNF